MTNTSQEILDDIRKDICIRIDYILKEAADKLNQIRLFKSVEDSAEESVSAAIKYLNQRYREQMDLFHECNNDLLQIMSLMESTSLHDKDNEIISKIREKYSCQVFDVSYEDE